MNVYLYHFFILDDRWGKSLTPLTAALSSGKGQGTHLIGGGVGPWAGLNVREYLTYLNSNPGPCLKHLNALI
jgi:hypothetical protein